MTRIETSLKVLFVLSKILLTAAYASAWWIFARGVTWGEASPLQVHLTVASIFVFLSLFADSCVIFYFVGTGVWMRDQRDALLVADRARALRIHAAYERANKLKGKAFPLPTMGIVFALFSYVLGGAIQVGAAPHWVHPLVATILLLCGWGAIPMVFSAMRANLDLLNGVSTELDALS